MMKTALICAKSWIELSDALPSLTTLGIIGSNILFIQLEDKKHGAHALLKKIMQLPYFYDVVSSDEQFVQELDTVVKITPNKLVVLHQPLR